MLFNQREIDELNLDFSQFYYFISYFVNFILLNLLGFRLN